MASASKPTRVKTVSAGPLLHLLLQAHSGLDENGPPRLIESPAWCPAQELTGRLRSCRLGESVSLGVGSEVSKALASPGSSLCLMLDPHGVKVRALSDRDSATPVCLLACPPRSPPWWS